MRGCTRSSLRVVALALGLAAIGRAGAQQTEPDKYQFRINVDLVSLHVTVTDTRNHFVTDLGRDNFSVFEDGVKQDVSVFSREDLPLRLDLLLDTSGSMDEKIGFAREAAIRLIDKVQERDLAQVIEFASKVHLLQRFTADRELLARAIRRTEAGGTTALYNALYISLRDLPREREDGRRQAIVVLSDGDDTSSIVSFDQVIELARSGDVVIFAISIRGDSGPRRKNTESELMFKRLAEETGGQFFVPHKLEDLAGVYQRIGDELRNQYNIGYVSSNPKRDGSWRRVIVQTNRENSSARARSGYYAPRSGG